MKCDWVYVESELDDGLPRLMFEVINFVDKRMPASSALDDFVSFSVREKMTLRASEMRLVNANSALSGNFLANPVEWSM